MSKREAIFEKTGFDINNQIKFKQAVEAEEEQPEKTQSRRRVTPAKQEANKRRVEK